MTYVTVDHKPNCGDPLYGYATRYPPSEISPSDGKRGFTTLYRYYVPEDVAAEMVEKGAKVEK